MSKEFLYSRIGLSVMVILALGVGIVPRSAAQGRPQLKRPENAPEEKPPEPKKKKLKGPRAVGILQMSGGKATLIPVAILVEGKFYDASVYKAEPVPMALEGGTVYEAERSGESLGLFTVNGALHSKYQGISPWLGTGPYFLNGTEAAKKTRKAEDVPVGIEESSDERPRLSRGGAAKTGASAPQSGTDTAGKTGTGTDKGPTQPSGGASGANEPDAPKSAGTPSTPAGTQTAAAPAANADKNSSQETQAARQKAAEENSAGQKSSGQSSGDAGAKGEPAGQGQAEGNYYRPTLRRGKPTQGAPEEVEPVPVVGKSGGSATVVKAATGPVELVPAISDGGGPEARSYKFFWKEGEEEERRKQMLGLAADEVRAYVSARAKSAIPAKAAAAAKSSAASRKAAVKPIEPDFENIQFHTFDVWLNYQPVMILNAEAHLPSGTSTAAGVETYNITLVARTDIYGNLRRLYSGVTDKFHLDVTPRMELIDVVDADGDGRGELLFRETTDAGSGYVIYRATADKLWKMFDSLGGE
jgi:hypothetical protein